MMKISKEQLPNILLGVAAAGLLGFALWSNYRSHNPAAASQFGNPPGQSVASPISGNNTQPVAPVAGGSNTGPNVPPASNSTPPVVPGASLPKDIFDAINARIDEAPVSRYSKDQKQALKTLLASAKSINLVETVVFDKGARGVDANGQRMLRSSWSARQMDQHSKQPDFFLVLIGYASPDGDRASNLRLAEERADQLADVVGTEFHVSKQKILRVAVGQTKLLDSSDTRNNRAVELWEAKIDPELIDAFR